MYKFLSSLAIIALSVNCYASEISMNPPKPVENKVLNAMVGNWKGESNIMGKKMQERLSISWSLNHQFLIMQLSSREIANPASHYEGLGVFGADSDGNVKTWWFDSWGPSSISEGSGKTHADQLTIHDGNANFKEERTFKVNGNTMEMSAKGSMNMDGKNMPYAQRTTYTK